MGDFASSTLICMLYEGLTRCGSDGTIEPGLAEACEISDDQKIYRFRLREAYWSDGTPITASDFERSWKKAFKPVGPNAYLFYPIKNCERCAKGEVGVEMLGIKALDEKILEVELEQPTSYFYSLTAFPSFMVYREEGIFSGPFCIDFMKLNDKIVLTKNEQFWNQSQTRVQKVEIHILPDEMTALQMFERGELDWLGGSFSPLPIDALDQWKDRLIFLPSAATTFCTFNTEKGPFQNVHLRKAFSYAINRREIIDKILQGGQTPPTSVLPPALSKTCFSLTNPLLAQKERQMCQEIGKIELLFKGTQVERRLAQVLQQQWKEVLGIEVELVQVDFKTHAQRLQERNYQIALGSWIAQFHDPISILERFKDRRHLKNFSGWENREFTQLLELAARSENREDLFQKAEELLASELPLTPLYHWSVPTLCNPRVERVIATPCGGILFDKVKMNPCKKFLNRP